MGRLKKAFEEAFDAIGTMNLLVLIVWLSAAICVWQDKATSFHQDVYHIVPVLYIIFLLFVTAICFWNDQR